MDGVAQLSLSLLCCLRFNEFQSCLMRWSYLSVCLCWTVSETMTVMQFKGNIGWSQGKDRERERLSGSEWRGNREGRWEKKKNNEETQKDEHDFKWLTRESMRIFKEQICTFANTHYEHYRIFLFWTIIRPHQSQKCLSRRICDAVINVLFCD